ncbi:MAG: deoxyribodipyrimidine photo-lyase [SAR202 cluster bacterium]|nr:deoxyribodipyrimidine photo-lyase [SAR202 cluster bacterium]
MAQSPKKVIWWIRRDMRLIDNPVLTNDIDRPLLVCPVFVIDPTLIGKYSAHNIRLEFMFNSLRSLNADIENEGGRINIHYGNPHEIIPVIYSEFGASEVRAQYDPSQVSRIRDTKIGKLVPLKLTSGLSVVGASDVRSQSDKAYKIFTPFYKSWWNKAIYNSSKLPKINGEIQFTNFGDPSILNKFLSNSNKQFPASEIEAQTRLNSFLSLTKSPTLGMVKYKSNKDRLDKIGTSQLSPYLRFGLISPRLVVNKAFDVLTRNPEFTSEVSTWISELAWRDFYIAKASNMHEFEDVNFTEYFPWRLDFEQYQSWCFGKTGYPIIDAIMRQLRIEGWISNRARMLAASFLTKQLLIDWRWGANWFMQHLIDGDSFANDGGWKWIAGVGAGAAPFFRIFNPIVQAKKYDPNGEYVRRWVPELSGLPSPYVHEPWLLTNGQRLDNKMNGYPLPIVDLHEARDRALTTYKKLRATT